jgi:hypothetical protein
MAISTSTGRDTPEMLRKRMELRRSGASGRHVDRRQRRVRTRQAAKARALKEAS